MKVYRSEKQNGKLSTLRNKEGGLTRLESLEIVYFTTEISTHFGEALWEVEIELPEEKKGMYMPFNEPDPDGYFDEPISKCWGRQHRGGETWWFSIPSGMLIGLASSIKRIV